MFAQDRDTVTILKQENKHFTKLFHDHNSLHDKIEADSEHLSDVELETLKKQKLKLKDELYAMIHDYKIQKSEKSLNKLKSFEPELVLLVVSINPNLVVMKIQSKIVEDIARIIKIFDNAKLNKTSFAGYENMNNNDLYNLTNKIIEELKVQ